ncbi:uncharacterized protein [Chironomus tepperi]|uniref:uncharacterized protein n=1 Tax=Chironomus tepperi TaxID=113505 RepID=UPI00391FA1D1
MDPLQILPEEIIDKIFSHLRIRDIQVISLVSKHWYNIIGQSKMCMKKLHIRRIDNFDDFESILNSNRHYQYLTFMFNESSLNKNTKLMRVMRDIVEKFSKSLVFVKTSIDLKLKSDLPKLKELEYKDYLSTHLIMSNGLITKAKNLEKLTVKCFKGLDKKSLKYIKDAILDNESLKILDVMDEIMQEPKHQNIKFKLDELSLSNFVLQRERKERLSSLDKFLSTQFSSLQVVTIPFDKEFMIYFMSNFPKLHTISLLTNYENSLSNDGLEYPTNQSIKKLAFKLYFFSDEPRFIHMCEVITKALNLQEIEFNYLPPEVLPFIYNSPMLKVVRYNYLSYNFPKNLKDEMDQHERIKFVQVNIRFFHTF